MATIFDTISIIGKRSTHFEQLLSYLQSAEDSGVYWGNKEQFYARHNELKEWLESIVDRARDPEYRIPKK
jgi:hypothetical protein